MFLMITLIRPYKVFKYILTYTLTLFLHIISVDFSVATIGSLSVVHETVVHCSKKTGQLYVNHMSIKLEKTDKQAGIQAILL